MAVPGTAHRLESLLQRFGLPTELPDHPRKAYLDALRVDKKSRNARIRYIVLRRIGRADAVDLSPAEILPSGRSRGGGPGRRSGEVP
jgi:3-dehydroquinate synthetase